VSAGSIKPLRTSPEFQAVREAGRRVAGKLCTVTLAAGADGLQAGFVTTKKLGNAVQRNRARRLMREALRQLVPGMVVPARVVVVAHAPMLAEGVKMQHVRDELKWLIERASPTGAKP
jgi:ribonuclease P protein component